MYIGIMNAWSGAFLSDYSVRRMAERSSWVSFCLLDCTRYQLLRNCLLLKMEDPASEHLAEAEISIEEKLALSSK